VNLTEPILSRFDILCVVKDIVNAEADERLAKFVIDSHSRSNKTVEDDDDGDDEGEDYNDDDEDDEDMDKTTPTRSKGLSRREKVNKLNKEKESEISPLSQDFLMKYIHYARTKVFPKLLQIEESKITKVYADLRTESKTAKSFPITVRHFESIIRTAEAFAKMRLAEFVSESDVDKAIEVAIGSFVGAQKTHARVALQKSFAKYTQKRKQRA
jgi:DNA replication licensing factor MCM2